MSSLFRRHWKTRSCARSTKQLKDATVDLGLRDEMTPIIGVVLLVCLVLYLVHRRSSQSTVHRRVVGASPVVTGPSSTEPSAAKREPCNGQSQDFSASFHATMPPR